MLWSSHPRNPHCDAAGPEVEGVNPNQERRYTLLVWLEPSNFCKPVPTATGKVSFDFSRHYLFLMLMIEEYLPRIPENLKKRASKRICSFLHASFTLIFFSLSGTKRDDPRNSPIWCQKEKEIQKKTQRACWPALPFLLSSFILIFISSSGAGRDNSRNTHI